MSTPRYLSKKFLTGTDHPTLDDLQFALQLNTAYRRLELYSKGWHEQVARSVKHYIAEMQAR